jgi:hypothetical protein
MKAQISFSCTTGSRIVLCSGLSGSLAYIEGGIRSDFKIFERGKYVDVRLASKDSFFLVFIDS